MPSIFSRIIAGEIPCHKIAENEHCFAFLDINPLAEGHTLVVPKQETDYLFDVDDRTLVELTLFSKQVAQALQKAIPCLRVGVAVVGLEVPHAHIHLIPLNSMDDINFARPKLKLSPDRLADIAAKVREQF
jgi:histidine triad (HIT) family protein